MDTTVKATRRKIIDIPEDIFRYLSVKAAMQGTNLKRYIEGLLAKDVEDMLAGIWMTMMHTGGFQKMNLTGM